MENIKAVDVPHAVKFVASKYDEIQQLYFELLENLEEQNEWICAEFINPMEMLASMKPAADDRYLALYVLAHLADWTILRFRLGNV